ncbi:hypothetical protein BH09CHL1_BH09CHL1_19480 [soil metagenome]
MPSVSFRSTNIVSELVLHVTGPGSQRDGGHKTLRYVRVLWAN